MQRALLCRALIAEPRLLILDEPATYVDSRFENELYGILRELNGGGAGYGTISGQCGKMAIVMVSHDDATLDGLAKTIFHVDGTVGKRKTNVN